MSSFRDYVARNLPKYVQELKEFVAIPSVASQGTGITQAAQFVRDALQRRGFRVDLRPTAGNPVVLGRAGSGRRLLLYNHYDVQPADPIDEWTSPPFAPELRDGKLFGRGVIDDKGEVVARLAAIDAVIDRFGELPLELITCVEGEEEVGSVSLPAFIRENRHELRADGCIWEAGMVDHDGRPRIWLGVRGLLYVTLTARTMRHDAHSGWAHVLPNAAWHLVHALSTLKDDTEHVLIDGFYDGVAPPTPAQSRLLDRTPDETAEYAAEYGVRRFAGGRSGTQLARSVFEPTCNISGLHGGHTEHGTKTVTPAQAFAKIDFRLVPGQDPNDILEKLRRHLDRRGFSDVEVHSEEGVHAACVDPDHSFVVLAIEALREAYGMEPSVVPMVGGTGPASYFVNELRVPFVSIGCSYPGARKHAPDENIRLADFVNGAVAIAQVMERVAAPARRE